MGLAAPALPTRETIRARSSLAASWVGLAILFATAAVSMYLVQVSSVATAGYELQRLEQERDGWIAKNQQLQFQLAERRSLTWVESQAAQRLGMVRADELQPLNASGADVTPTGQRILASSRGGSRPSATATSAAPPTGASAPRPPARPEPGSPGAALPVLQSWLAMLTGILH
jgi:cell division protein FtsB